MILKAEHLILGDGKTVLEQGAVCVDSEGKIKNVGPSDQVVQQNPGEEIRDYRTISKLLRPNCALIACSSMYTCVPGLAPIDSFP